MFGYPGNAVMNCVLGRVLQPCDSVVSVPGFYPQIQTDLRRLGSRAGASDLRESVDRMHTGFSLQY